MRNKKAIVALGVTLCVAVGSSTLVAQKKDEPKRSKAEQLDIDVLLRASDLVESGQAMPTESMVTWESNHFVRAADGGTYVPFTVRLDRTKLTAPNVAVYVRVDPKGTALAAPGKNNKDKGPAHVYENVYFAAVSPSGAVSRRF